MWHVSVAHQKLAKRREIAERALYGVGDRRLGQWRENRGRAYHIRRRLTDNEAALVGPLLDIRNTIEADGRARAVALHLPPAFAEQVVRQPF